MNCCGRVVRGGGSALRKHGEDHLYSLLAQRWFGERASESLLAVVDLDDLGIRESHAPSNDTHAFRFVGPDKVNPFDECFDGAATHLGLALHESRLRH